MITDLRFAFRSLLKTPGFTLTALLTLALGLGVNTSMFTVTNTLLFQPAPFASPETLVRIFRTSPQSQNWPHSAANFLDYRAQSRSFAAMAAYNFTDCNYAAAGQPAERLRGMDVTGDFFPMLGVNAARGRTFSPEEIQPGGPRVVVLSHECWLTRFGGDPGIVNRQLRIDGELATVVGVMPAGFAPSLLWGPVQLWRPLVFTAAEAAVRGSNYLQAFGRLAPGVPLARARTELDGIAARLALEYPITNAGNALNLIPYRIQPDLSSQRLTWFVMGLAGFVLLIACANLANLQYARTARRMREHAIRLALGAPRWRIMRELLAESLLLSLAGGVAGLLVTLWCNDLIGRHVVFGPVTGLALPLDARVFGFSLLVSLACGLGFGLLPAWVAARADVNAALKSQARGSTTDRSQHRLRRVLIVAEVALALMLLAGAGVFIRGLERFTGRDPGWRPEGLMGGRISLPASKYPDADSRRAFFAKLEQNLAANPVITHNAIASSLPTGGYSSSTTFIAEGRPLPAVGREPLSHLVYVSPDYFATLDLPLRQGRTFHADDRAGRPAVVIINETMARTFWPGENPVGRRIGDSDPNEPNWLEIIGVVGDARHPGALNPPDTRFQYYRPVAQETFSFATVVVRGRVAPEMLAAELRRAVAAIDPDQPVHSLATVEADIARGLANYQLRGAILGGFAVLGLALAAIGIYGVLAGLVAQRTAEIGVRMALGAQLGDILRMVLGPGLGLAAIGAGLGLAGAFGLTHLLTRILPELGAPDSTVIGGAAVILLLAAALACWLPARKAARVDPLEALRSE